MTAKEHLQQVYVINQKIKRLEARRDDLRQDLYSVKSPDLKADRVQTTHSGDKMLKLIAKVDEVERDIIRSIERLTDTKETIIKEIESVPEERYRQLLFDRYILCKKWEQIACDMDKGIRWIFRMHGKALKSFAMTIEKP